MQQFLQERARVGKEDLVLFSDVDVIPLRNFSDLTPLNSSGMWDSASDIFFMRERHDHPGLSNWAVNVRLCSVKPFAYLHDCAFIRVALYIYLAVLYCSWQSGFYLLRNTQNVRKFFTYWSIVLASNRKMKDQDAANFLLLKKNSDAKLNWDIFHPEEVTGNTSEITARTVAYHAIRAPWVEDKRKMYLEAFERVRGRVPATTLEMCKPTAGVC